MNIYKGWAFPRGIYSEVHSPITTPEIICVMALTLQPIRGCPQHSGKKGKTIIVGDSQTSPLLIFPEGGGTSVHRLWSRLWCENALTHVLWRTWTSGYEFFFFFLNLSAVRMKSTPGKFACILHFKRIGINAEKLKKREFIFKVTFSLPSSSSMIWRLQMSEGVIHPPRSITPSSMISRILQIIYTRPFPIIAW